MKLIPNYPQYSITTDGRVFSHRKPAGVGKGNVLDYSYKKERKQHKSREGYIKVELTNKTGKKTLYVHRLVALTYIPNPHNYKTVNHINEDKADNRVENLEWMTQADNVEYSKAKRYLIETPNGEIIEVYNLNKWCREVLGYRSPSGMNRTLRNPKRRCKGYRLIKRVTSPTGPLASGA